MLRCSSLCCDWFLFDFILFSHRCFRWSEQIKKTQQPIRRCWDCCAVLEAFIAVLDVHTGESDLVYTHQHLPSTLYPYYRNITQDVVTPLKMCAYHMNSAPVVYDVQNSTLFGHLLFSDCYSNIVSSAATMFLSVQYQPVIMSVIGSIIVGLSGLFPLLVLPVDDTISLKTGREYMRLFILFFKNY